MNNTQRLRFSLYILAIVIVILSRITTVVDYNIAMSIASLILAITLCVDAYVFAQERKKIKTGLCLFFSLLILLALIYLWMFKL